MNLHSKKIQDRVDFLRNQIGKQRRWIEECENGISYDDGERGQRIRQADMNALRELTDELAALDSVDA